MDLRSKIRGVIVQTHKTPYEQSEEILQLITENYQAFQLRKTQVSGSVYLDTELQILLGDLMQQKESSFCYLEKKKITNKINAVCVLLGIDTVW